MKKILFFIIGLFLINISQVTAVEQYQLIDRCYYSSDNGIRMELSIATYADRYTPVDELEYEASAELMEDYGNKKVGDWWYVDDWDPQNKTCPQYLLYDYNPGFIVDFAGDHVYASDTLPSTGNNEFVLELETDKVNGIVETEENCKIQELHCVYGSSGSIVIEYKNGQFDADISGLQASINNTDYNNFITENNAYICPSHIYVSTTLDIASVSFQEPTDGSVTQHDLQVYASYITCDEENTATVGKTCSYKNSYGNNVLGLTGYSDGTYGVAFDDKSLNITVDITGNKIQESCENLPVLYTDCLDKRNGQDCTISETNFDGAEKITYNPNVQTAEDVTASLSVINGEKYETLMCRIKSYLNSKGANISRLPAIDSNGRTLSDLNCTNICANGSCNGNEDYLIEQGLKDVLYYCSEDIYPNFIKYFDSDSYSSVEDRMEECIAFNTFYEQGVQNNIFADYTVDCAILSDDFVKILTDILDIVKIAGPLLALGLGMLDFIKVIANGDADKEMKTAFKRFLTRIIAAVLLFLVPLILAFLLDLFLGNQDGYNSDNPFCDVVDLE